MKLRPGIRYSLNVEFEVELPVEYAEVKEFIKDALEAWGGQFHPNEPLFGSLEKVKPSHLRIVYRHERLD